MTIPSDAEPRELSLRFSSGGELRETICRIIDLSRHALVMYSRDLDPVITDHVDVLEALRRRSLSGRGASIRILLQDSTRAVRDGHRLIEQARRLSSVYSLRRVHPEDMQYPSAFVVNDTGGFLFRTFGDRFDGEGHTHHPAGANSLLR